MALPKKIYHFLLFLTDSFLYQLRSFQKLKSSLLDPHQMDHFMQESRIASKDLIQCLFPSNVSWFAEFFCDLLLQIGLVPMQETDADILSHVSDQDKLQVRRLMQVHVIFCRGYFG